VLIVPGSSQFSFYTEESGRTIVSEAQPGEEGCAVFPVQPNRTSAQAPTTAAIFKAQYTAAAQFAAKAGLDYDKNGGNGPTQGVPSAIEGAINVDVLVLYDADCLDTTKYAWTNHILYNNRDGTIQPAPSNVPDFIDGRSKAFIESGNVVLANSGVTNFQWRYLAAVQAPAYTRPSPIIEHDLTAISPTGSIGEWVKSVEYTYGADQVFLWRGDSTGAIAGGIANGPKQLPVTKNDGRAVGGWGGSYKVLIHELAHNFGCHHDRANATTVTASDGDGFYCYDTLWSIPSQVGGYNTASTIMGYGGAVIPYFATPGISVHVTSALAAENPGIGDWGTQALGLPVGDPRAAYNAKVLTDNAPAMAALIEAITIPAITTHPQDKTASTGGSFSLSVTASGGGLSYQWKKDGVAISGATAAIYSKGSISSTDAGNYTVVANNNAGSATSNAAAVSVTAAPPPPPSGGGSGGGGGGGALSDWFMGALALLALGRTRFFHRPKK